MTKYAYLALFAIAAALFGARSATAVRADLRVREGICPTVVDTSHSTLPASEFLYNSFNAKSSDNVTSWLQFFNPVQVVYYDATVGAGSPNRSSLVTTLNQYVSTWPKNASSCPLQILGDTHSAVVHFVDTPGLFGAEIRAISATDFRNGTIARQVDYWDGRRNPVINNRPPGSQYPYDLGVNTVAETADPKIDTVARQLNAAFASGNSTIAATLFSYNAIFEDNTLRARLEGQLAIGRYLQRALSHLPYGLGAKVRHVLGSSRGGGYEWESNNPLLNGIIALELGSDGLITKLSTVWDGSRMDDSAIQALSGLSIEP